DLDNFRARDWRSAVRRAGLDPLRIHDLRHTCASLAIAAGADVLSLQRMLGHANPAITLNRYGHLMPGQAEAVADRLDELARRTPAGPHAQVVNIWRAR
ncbi:MAG: tyrosine-type recombinase/integrase, partial [Acidimicrobiales bacterium]